MVKKGKMTNAHQGQRGESAHKYTYTPDNNASKISPPHPPTWTRKDPTRSSSKAYQRLHKLNEKVEADVGRGRGFERERRGKRAGQLTVCLDRSHHICEPTDSNG